MSILFMRSKILNETNSLTVKQLVVRSTESSRLDRERQNEAVQHACCSNLMRFGRMLFFSILGE